MTTPNQSEISIRLNGQEIGVARVSARIDEAGRFILTLTGPDPAAEIAGLREEVDRLRAALDENVRERGLVPRHEYERKMRAINAGLSTANLVLRAEIASLKAERDDCPTCEDDGMVHPITTVAGADDWIEREDPADAFVCPECEGTKRSLVTRQKAEIAALKEAGRRLDNQMELLTWVSTGRDGERIAGVRFSDITAERDALRALCTEDPEGAATGTVPVLATPAEMPEPLMMNGILVAECCFEMVDRRRIKIHDDSLTIGEAAALLAWLPRAIAWQKGVP